MTMMADRSLKTLTGAQSMLCCDVSTPLLLMKKNGAISTLFILVFTPLFDLIPYLCHTPELNGWAGGARTAGDTGRSEWSEWITPPTE